MSTIPILSVATANPPLRMRQEESLDYILRHFPMRPATGELYKRVFQNASIETRSFALATPDEVLEVDPDRIAERFRTRASELSRQSLSAAIHHAGITPQDLRYVCAATCTGYLCPGLSSYLIESCGLPRDLHFVDAVGMGCGAALPALEQAAGFLIAHPDGWAATVNTEICSAAMFSDDDIELVISNAIFADGSAACVLAGPEQRFSKAPCAQLVGFASRTYPEWRESLRFKQEGGRLRNVLKKEVPEQAGQALREVMGDLLLRPTYLTPVLG